MIKSLRSESLKLYRDILRATKLFTWPNEKGELWSEILRKNARREFEQARHESDPQIITKLLFVVHEDIYRAAAIFASSYVSRLLHIFPTDAGLYYVTVYSSIPLPASSIPDVSEPSILSSLYSFTYDSLPDETLYILDGTSMLFHAYYREKLSNLSCGPLVVMAMHFARLVRDVKPKYITVAFDSGKHLLERRLAYPEYKKNRAQTPVELLPLIVLAPSIFEALGCKCIKLVGHEADDLMASVGKWARLRGLNVVHVSQDKDLLQLVGTGVHVMIPRGREMMGAEQVVNKFGVSPELFRDYQAIMGDATDNIPGVGGLGPVAAAALVNHFKCVDAMCTSLRLPGLAPPPPELLSPNPNWKKLALHLQNLLSEDVYHNIALPELTKALANTKSMKASTVLAKLYICGHDNLLLYRRLVTLKDDLEISDILHYSNSTRVRFAALKRVYKVFFVVPTDSRRPPSKK
eukprot:gene25655-34228_t